MPHQCSERFHFSEFHRKEIPNQLLPELAHSLACLSYSYSFFFFKLIILYIGFLDICHTSALNDFIFQNSMRKEKSSLPHIADIP